MASTITESLVDAKDEARQAEVRTDISEAVNGFERRMVQVAFWIIGWTTALVLGAAGLIISVLR
ncbi:MAG: hypothetical protein OXF41_19875 [bacterium]|nr:hypothetical protein [bacterium]